MKKVLELFSGTGCVGKVCQEYGYDVISLDYNKKFKSTHVVDILEWDYTIYPKDYFDIIWASPDCTTWSLATGGKYRTKANIYGLNNIYQSRATIGNNMILKVIEILDYFKPSKWYIENPRGQLQHYPPLQNFIKEVNGNMTVVYYGNYNWGFPKPTNIWSNMKLWDNEKMPIMDESTYVLKYHNYDQKYKRYYKAFTDGNSEERSKIPSQLIKRLLNLTEKII